jgi:hypothetical protein
MPALWSGIFIYLPYCDWTKHDKTLSFARQWLDRAQDMRRSLSIDFLLVPGISLHLHDLWEQLLGFMAQYQLKELELAYPIDHLALKLPDHVWQSIEHLHLETLDNVQASGGQHLFSNFGKLSNLRHLKIFGSHNLDGMDRIVPWHQLRTFDVGGIWEGTVTPSLCLNVLRQSRLLERCRITLSKEPSFTSTVISTKEKIVLANMDYFKVKFRDGFRGINVPPSCPILPHSPLLRLALH